MRGLQLAMFGAAPTRQMRSGALLRLRLAPASPVVPVRVIWAAERLSEAWGEYPFKLPEGFTFVGGGGTRMVYRYGDYVVKLPREGRQHLQFNQQEAETWRDAPAEVRRYLVPVLAADDDGHWLIMPYAPNVVPRYEALKLCDQLGARFPLVFTDCGHLENWRYYQGHARLIDYPDELGQHTRRYAHGRKG